MLAPGQQILARYRQPSTGRGMSSRHHSRAAGRVGCWLGDARLGYGWPCRWPLCRRRFPGDGRFAHQNDCSNGAFSSAIGWPRCVGRVAGVLNPSRRYDVGAVPMPPIMPGTRQSRPRGLGDVDNDHGRRISARAFWGRRRYRLTTAMPMVMFGVGPGLYVHPQHVYGGHDAQGGGNGPAP